MIAMLERKASKPSGWTIGGRCRPPVLRAAVRAVKPRRRPRAGLAARIPALPSVDYYVKCTFKIAISTARYRVALTRERPPGQGDGSRIANPPNVAAIGGSVPPLVENLSTHTEKASALPAESIEVSIPGLADDDGGLTVNSPLEDGEYLADS